MHLKQMAQILALLQHLVRNLYPLSTTPLMRPHPKAFPITCMTSRVSHLFLSLLHPDPCTPHLMSLSLLHPDPMSLSLLHPDPCTPHLMSLSLLHPDPMSLSLLHPDPCTPHLMSLSLLHPDPMSLSPCPSPCYTLIHVPLIPCPSP